MAAPVLDCREPINIQFTSGTTGNAKGATLTHHNVVNNGRFIAQGEGLVFADLGRTITTVEGVVFSAGQHSETLFPNVCEALG